MKLIDRAKFYNKYPFRPLSQSQVDNLNFILDKLDASDSITRLNEYAYVLATIKHETADTFAPVTERGSQKYLKSKPYYPYIGRGYVQLTWKWNYEKFGKLLNIPLADNPALANEPETAWRVLELGMTKGLFTGKKLGDYFKTLPPSNLPPKEGDALNGEGHDLMDFYNERRIINGLDCAGLIQAYAEKYYSILSFDENE